MGVMCDYNHYTIIIIIIALLFHNIQTQQLSKKQTSCTVDIPMQYIKTCITVILRETLHGKPQNMSIELLDYFGILITMLNLIKLMHMYLTESV